jgi:hypothetical protein
MIPSGNSASLSVHALVTPGTAIGAKNRRGETALFVAVQLSRYEAAQKLLKFGPDVGEPDFGRYPPLLIALIRQDLYFVQLLSADRAYSGAILVSQKSTAALHQATDVRLDPWSGKYWRRKLMSTIETPGTKCRCIAMSPMAVLEWLPHSHRLVRMLRRGVTR